MICNSMQARPHEYGTCSVVGTDGPGNAFVCLPCAFCCAHQPSQEHHCRDPTPQVRAFGRHVTAPAVAIAMPPTCPTLRTARLHSLAVPRRARDAARLHVRRDTLLLAARAQRHAAVAGGPEVVVVLLDRQHGAQDFIAWLAPLGYERSVRHLFPDKPLELGLGRSGIGFGKISSSQVDKEVDVGMRTREEVYVYRYVACRCMGRWGPTVEEAGSCPTTSSRRQLSVHRCTP